MKYWLILLTLFASAAQAQTVAEVNGGASDYLGTGAGVTLYAPSGETRFSAGVIGGRFTYSASERFDFRGWEMDVGSTQFGLTSGQMFLTAPLNGVAAIKKYKKAQLLVFGGAVGAVYSSPYFWGLTKSHLGGGLSYKRDVGHGFTLGTIQAISGPMKTSLEEARYRYKFFDAHTDVGWLQNAFQTNGAASFTWTHMGGSATRSLYVFQPEPGVVVPVGQVGQTTVTNLSAYGNESIFSESISWFDSTTSKGQNFGAGARLGLVSIQISDYASKSLTSKQTGQLVSISERMGLHITLTEYGSHSDGQFNWNVGGAYTSNRWSASAGYSILYFPMLQQPFQKVLTISVGLNIRSMHIGGSTVALPNGKTQWSTSAGDYIATPLKIPTIPGATAADVRSLASSGHGGKNVIQISVVDDQGMPVEGAAVKIGNDVVWVDSQGHGSIREKKAVNPVVVDFANFLNGRWVTVSAPTDTSGGTVKIVLRRAS